MNVPTYPSVLAPTYWERQAGALAKAKPATLADELKALERSFGALDFNLLDVDKLAGVAEAELRDELLVVDKAQVDALVKRLRKAMPRAKHRLLQTTLDAVAEKQFSARLFAQEVR